MASRQFARFGEDRLWPVCVLAAAAFALALAGTAERANARTDGEPGAGTGKRSGKAKPGPILAVVSLARQRVWVYGSAGLIAQSAVSTGMAGHRTPTGVFSVLQKSRFHESNIYSNAAMPYMQRITWSGIALHAGVLPGYPASHGCIRLPHQFAVELWGMTRIGARVVVVPDDASVFHIEHARLPVPKLTPAPREENGSPVAEAAVVNAALGEVADKTAAVRLLNPVERAQVERTRAVAEASAKAKAAKAGVETSASKAAEASRAIAALRKAEWTLATARAERDAAAKAGEAAVEPEVAERARAALAAVEVEIAALEKAAEAARAVEAAATPEAFAAARAAWQAQKAAAEAAAALKATERSTEPVSILVSKKAGRVYVRQGWAPIHEAPVAFRQSDAPIGTHVYLATGPEADNRAQRWLSVSIPPPPPAAGTRAGARQDEREQGAPAKVTPHDQASPTALTALARFELPAETKRLVEDKLWTGATLIVSDEDISSETGATTDFIVLTR